MNTEKVKKYETALKPGLNISPDSASNFEFRLHSFFLTRLGELMPGFLHNLGNPLSVILGNAELLSMTYDKDIVHDIITMATDIKLEIKKLQKILHSTLASGKRYASLEDVVLSQIQILRNDLTFKHKIKMTVNLHPDTPDFIVPALPASALFAIILKNIITDFRLKSELQGLESMDVQLFNTRKDIPEIRILASNNIEFIDEQDDLFFQLIDYLSCKYSVQSSEKGTSELTLSFEIENG